MTSPYRGSVNKTRGSITGSNDTVNPISLYRWTDLGKGIINRTRYSRNALQMTHNDISVTNKEVE